MRLLPNSTAIFNWTDRRKASVFDKCAKDLVVHFKWPEAQGMVGTTFF